MSPRTTRSSAVNQSPSLPSKDDVIAAPPPVNVRMDVDEPVKEHQPGEGRAFDVPAKAPHTEKPGEEGTEFDDMPDLEEVDDKNEEPGPDPAILEANMQLFAQDTAAQMARTEQAIAAASEGVGAPSIGGPMDLAAARADFQGRHYYLGNSQFNAEQIYRWARRGFKDLLVVKGSGPTADGAVLMLVVRIGDANFYWDATAGYVRPTRFTASLSSAKGSAQGEMPDVPTFQPDFTAALSNLSVLQAAVATSGSTKKGLFVSDKTLRVKHVPFLKKSSFVAEGEDDDLPPEFKFENLPTRSDIAKAELEKMKDTHTFNPLPAYNVDGDLIAPKDYDIALRGATVALSFTLTHYAIASRESDSAPGSDTYVADVVKIRVLVPPAPHVLEESPRKRLLRRDDDSFPARKVARVA